MNALKKLTHLRELMQKHSIHAYIIPSADAHQSEYVSDDQARRGYISGFNGSAGTAFVTLDKALLFTDGRYFLQAEQQLDSSCWKLMKEGIDPSLTSWITSNGNMTKGSVVGVDPFLYSVQGFEDLEKSIKTNPELDLTVKTIQQNLVDQVWTDRPSAPHGKIFKLDKEFTGRDVQDKLTQVRSEMKTKECSFYVLTALDEIAWLLNLRGADIAFNTLFISYLLVTLDNAYLFVDESKFENVELKKELEEKDGVLIRPYDSFCKELCQLTEKDKGLKCFIDPKTCNYAVLENIKCKVVRDNSFVKIIKAVKNDTEKQGFRDCHVRDGASLVRYLAWLENHLKEGNTINEYDAALKLEEFRKENDLFIGLSFQTISGYGSNGAIIHYGPDPKNSATVGTSSLYLVDSGAHYKDGTTDVTRTVHFGEATQYQKRCFTRVLQGHIALTTLVFPEGTSGYRLDAIARTPLWQDGLDYNHGTGHGVGHGLVVHEGPHGITYRSIVVNDFGLKESMIVTDEPGYYEPGNFGIRIENILIVKPVETLKKFNDKQYLGFEHVTLCPMQPSLIDTNLLSKKEIEWINAYNQEVREKLSPLLHSDGLALAYLEKNTAPLQ